MHISISPVSKTTFSLIFEQYLTIRSSTDPKGSLMITFLNRSGNLAASFKINPAALLLASPLQLFNLYSSSKVRLVNKTFPPI